MRDFVMKARIKGIATLLAFILLFSCALGGSSGIAAPRAEIFVPSQSIPTPSSSEVPPPESSSEVPPETSSAPPPESSSEPPPSTTAAPPPPSQTTVPATTLTEPYSSTNVTVGSAISGVNAKKAFVYDCESRTFLYMKSEADAKLYPASITKLLNVYTALQYLSPQDILTMTADISKLVPVDTSRAGIYSGHRLSVEMVIRAALIPSGSDAAHLLAVSAGRIIAGDSTLSAQAAEDAFVAEMNHQAELLGLVNTHFVNCDGYPNYYHYTCMADLVTIATVCLDTPLIRNTVSCSKATLTFADGSSRTVNSTNKLLDPNSTYYRSTARGMKTGTTDAAGACLLSAFWTGERYLLVGVFQSPSNAARYSSAVKLYDTFANYAPPVIEPDPPTQTTAQTSVPSSSTQIPTSEIPSTTQTPTTLFPTTGNITPPPAPTPPTLTASHAFVYNASQRQLLFQKGVSDEKVYPASITKLFTAYVALQFLSPTDQITVGSIVTTIPSNASKAFISQGDVLTVNDLLMGMLLPSGNDAAHVLAVAAGRVIADDAQLSETDALAVFVGEMNRQAALVGMVNTHFVNPDGWPTQEHYTCLSDLLLMGTLSLDDPTIRAAAGTYQYSVTLPSRTLQWTNTNLLLKPDSEYYLPTAIGLKTGYTSAAGRCLLSAYLIDGEWILAGVFGCPDPSFTMVTQFIDTHALYNTYIDP